MLRPFDSTERISKILRYKKILAHSKWRKNAYFSPKSVILWVWVTQLWQIIPFSATSEQGQINGLVYLEIWRHQKFKSVRVPPLRSAKKRFSPKSRFPQGCQLGTHLISKLGYFLTSFQSKPDIPPNLQGSTQICMIYPRLSVLFLTTADSMTV